MTKGTCETCEKSPVEPGGQRGIVRLRSLALLEHTGGALRRWRLCLRGRRTDARLLDRPECHRVQLVACELKYET